MKKERGISHIGTSGWSYKHWKELYYPSDIKPTQWLTYISQEFECTEINTSFYSLPKPETVLNWAAITEPHFMFCPKLSRMITHFKKLHDPEESLRLFFSVFDPIAHRLGPVLVQLPRQVRFHAAVAEPFFRVLSEQYGHYQFSLEVRDDSWLAKESMALMERYGIGWVIAQSAQPFPYLEAVTAPHIYLRFHGPEALYSSSYHPLTLRAYAKKIAGWTKSGHNVWAFFNNDVGGHALANARSLKKMVAEYE